MEGEAAGKEPVLSSSDLSDIVTLGDVKEDEHTEEEAPIHEDLYLGTSSSSHYAFTSAAAETGTHSPTHSFASNSSHVFSNKLVIPVWLKMSTKRKSTQEFLLRFFVQSVELPAEFDELKLSSEKSICWGPLSYRWIDWNWSDSVDAMLVSPHSGLILTSLNDFSWKNAAKKSVQVKNYQN